MIKNINTNNNNNNNNILGVQWEGVQWMGVVLYSKIVYNTIQVTTPCFHCTPPFAECRFIMRVQLSAARETEHGIAETVP